jgi:glutamyl-tRNA reductase
MDRQTEPGVVALIAAAPAVPGAAREQLRSHVEAVAGRLGVVVVETCHRVELVGGEAVASAPSFAELVAAAPPGAIRLDGTAAARHVVSLAVGLESMVLAEDQVLHQLRSAVGRARGRSRLAPELEALLEAALRAGRTARSWRPGGGRSLADVALDRAVAAGITLERSTVIVVGTGEMGRLVARTARARGARVAVAGRTADRARIAADAVGATVVPFDPGAAVSEATVVVIALRGSWTIAPVTAAALRDVPVVVDLSQPAALADDARPRHALGIDDLGEGAGPVGSDALRRRLEGLREARLADYLDWWDRRSALAAARSLAGHIEHERLEALAALWRRRPDLGASEQAEIDALTRRLAERLFREPFERLRRDPDGSREQAARELFGL